VVRMLAGNCLAVGGDYFYIGHIKGREGEMIQRLRFQLSLFLLAVVMAVVPARVAFSQTLAELYLLDELFPIMAAEGISSAGDEAATPLDPSEVGQWRRDIARIYDATAMQAAFSDALDTALVGRDDIIRDAADFARSDLGERVLQLEVTARAALLDDAIDELAREALVVARAAPDGSPLNLRLGLIRDRIAVNDLIELNVSLGMNTSYAYYMGMLSESEMLGLGAQDVLSLVWSQEEDIRSDVRDWIESYFLMAYQPLSDDDLRAYVDWSGSAYGDAFNRAMFQAFDTVFVDISRQVGMTLGRALSGQSL
jgi:signal transduction histidine kinase